MRRNDGPLCVLSSAFRYGTARERRRVPRLASVPHLSALDPHLQLIHHHRLASDPKPLLQFVNSALKAHLIGRISRQLSHFRTRTRLNGRLCDSDFVLSSFLLLSLAIIFLKFLSIGDRHYARKPLVRRVTLRLSCSRYQSFPISHSTDP